VGIDTAVRGPWHADHNCDQDGTRCVCADASSNITFECEITHTVSPLTDAVVESSKKQTLWMYHEVVIASTLRLASQGCSLAITVGRERWRLRARGGRITVRDCHTIPFSRNVKKCDSCCENEFRAFGNVSLISIPGSERDSGYPEYAIDQYYIQRRTDSYTSEKIVRNSKGDEIDRQAGERQYTHHAEYGSRGYGYGGRIAHCGSGFVPMNRTKGVLANDGMTDAEFKRGIWVSATQEFQGEPLGGDEFRHPPKQGDDARKLIALGAGGVFGEGVASFVAPSRRWASGSLGGGRLGAAQRPQSWVDAFTASLAARRSDLPLSEPPLDVTTVGPHRG
jgi:hypothetical protein